MKALVWIGIAMVICWGVLWLGIKMAVAAVHLLLLLGLVLIVWGLVHGRSSAPR
jgi:Flp pilus assembly protein TadB